MEKQGETRETGKEGKGKAITRREERKKGGDASQRSKIISVLFINIRFKQGSRVVHVELVSSENIVEKKQIR